ncbi:hypothetical protein DEO72_LG1g2408 [Vigna unguiculata]|uniref:Uncharacterized protein n=1 Tax=Vigna unguiculata TaxID=3917 RepID=A0A4D6KML0_VIGUN|nr:hypothetical protein DEO72_LG1g2408 [Vigna unguiculata]
MVPGGKVCSVRRQTLKQWVCLEPGTWRRGCLARQSALVSPGDAYAAPNDNAAVSGLCVLFLNSDATLGLGDVVP